jgi:hypothetical protein
MSLHVFAVSPFLREAEVAVHLDIHVAVTAQAAWFKPDRSEDRFDGLQDFLTFWRRHCHLDGDINHGISP